MPVILTIIEIQAIKTYQRSLFLPPTRAFLKNQEKALLSDRKSYHLTWWCLSGTCSLWKSPFILNVTLNDLFLFLVCGECHNHQWQSTIQTQRLTLGFIQALFICRSYQTKFGKYMYMYRLVKCVVMYVFITEH